MEEDVEIELLLKSNEAILMEAGKLTTAEGNAHEGIEWSDEFAEENISENNIWLADIDRNKHEHNLNITSDNGTIIKSKAVLNPSLSSQIENKENKVNFNYLDKNNATISGIANNCEILCDLTGDESDNIVTGDNRIDVSNNTGTVINYDNEVEELLDSQILTCISENTVKRNLSDSEDSSSLGDFLRFKELTCNTQDGKDSKRQTRKNNIPSVIGHLLTAQALLSKRQQLLVDLELKLREKIRKNEESQNQLKNKIDSINRKDNNKAKEPSYTKCFFKKFGTPYFEDVNGFTPPPNEDHKKKIKNGELIITLVPKVNYWVKSEKELFMGTIKQTLIKENSEKLTKTINKLKTELSTLPPDNEHDVLLSKIATNQEKLASLRNMSYTDLVSQEDPNREYDWMKYSASVFNGLHTPEECKRYWNIYLKPSINRDSWKIDEDLKLENIAEVLHYQDWDAIAESLGTNRTAYQCFVHYQTQLRHENIHSQGKWTKEEDKKLLAVINDSKVGDFIPWTKVSSYIGNRTHTQVYNRWSNCLNPQLLKGKFSKEEDFLIVSAVEIFGSNYKEISSLLSNRTCAQIRDRYERHLLMKSSNVGTWSLKEDEKLLKLVATHGESSWARIANEMKTRSRTQVRQRYNFIQHMSKTKTGWNITQVKRRNVQYLSKGVSKTWKKVEKLKKEMEKAESELALSKLEKDTFRIEKLRQLRDEILKKKYDIKFKHKISYVNSELNNLLIDHFKNCSLHSKGYKYVSDQICKKDYVHEMLLMAQFFEHELKFPECKENIWKNQRLDRNLKLFLSETLEDLIETSNRNNGDENGAITSNPSIMHNIDYIMPVVDDTILMKEWWYTSPIDVSRLNFSEFFKRTVFDYSYGMHKDIWEAKVHRSKTVTLNDENSDFRRSVTPLQKCYTTPNMLNLLGLRGVFLDRTRLRRTAAGKTFLKLTSSYLSVKEQPLQADFNNVKSELLDKFQEILITLFTWPRCLALTDINFSLVLLKETVQTTNRTKPCVKGKFTVQNNSNEEADDNSVVKIPKSNIDVGFSKIYREHLNFNQQFTTFKRESKNRNKGITCKRKMNIEELKKSKLKEDHKKLKQMKTRYKKKLKVKIVESCKSMSANNTSSCHSNRPKRKSKCIEDENTTNEITATRSKKPALKPRSDKKTKNEETTVKSNSIAKCNNNDSGELVAVSLRNLKRTYGCTTRSQKRKHNMKCEKLSK